ncbi:sensor histidine kinase [Peptostreptococcus anaerobius]|uniref:sensor histidine kinase n=1 Tax=Peptostreptococcus anaerobius TaxID=1261 RepID=UPI00242F4423|nr:HAMP domain-containing sensor histidine kinase [Peptostreptococcus anaerobius]MDU0964882.1 HAMP domain-containing sensor histidine kinase [Peptostreptococcus anaerobius]MDU0998629.1 HAMP domain-containing sensor histidine kinase [Peptostreptococcus anaerobius]MDU1174269.1 HAMP domain-containing sensor histidine kinase [Peptostreptococcus anaerobius]MDU1232779.1 HAMP domain-containing sensor histidine kinase [Peptostreptococcus anaerobius]
MELKSKGKSLKNILFKYLLSIGLGLAISVLLILAFISASFQFKWIFPANYTENLILEKRTDIATSKNFEKSLLPDNTSYLFLSKDEKVVDTNMNKNIQDIAFNYHKGAVNSNSNLSFIEIQRSDGYVVVAYDLKPFYKSPWMQKNLPQVNNLFLSLLIIFCLISIITITLIWAKKLAKELNPLLEASEEIGKQNLDFQVKKSNIQEFNVILESLEKMKVGLSESLRTNWREEEKKRNQISALSHDIKTPLSIIKGNSELLGETNLTEEQQTYLNYIRKNTSRIDKYIQTLMLVNKSNQANELNFTQIRAKEFVENIEKLAKEFTSTYKLNLLEDINYDDDFLIVDLKNFERAFLNILSNAEEQSPKSSTIKLIICSKTDKLQISILDQGHGFTGEDLLYATDQFYQGDKSRHSKENYGIGLFVAEQIINMHGGSLILENRTDECGAKVSILLPVKNTQE